MSDIPPECEAKGCSLKPRRKVTFKNPEDTVYYCKTHAFAKMDENTEDVEHITT